MAELTLEQKNHLYENGWVVIPQVVPPTMIREARNAINSTVEHYLDSIQSRSPELRSDERLKSLLFKTEASSLAKSVLGSKASPSQNIQAALRFPELEPQPRPLVPHIDGFHPAADGQPAAIRPFAALVGFFLNDTENDWSGNFTVWPATHRTFEDYFRKHGPDPELKLGIPPVNLPQPVQLKAKAGDMIIAHYQLAHSASSNLSGSVRYAVYFRFHHDDRPKDSIDVLSDIWRYWDGMKDVVRGS
jgi:hypothetical protein